MKVFLLLNMYDVSEKQHLKQLGWCLFWFLAKLQIHQLVSVITIYIDIFTRFYTEKLELQPNHSTSLYLSCISNHYVTYRSLITCWQTDTRTTDRPIKYSKSVLILLGYLKPYMSVVRLQTGHDKEMFVSTAFWRLFTTIHVLDQVAIRHNIIG